MVRVADDVRAVVGVVAPQRESDRERLAELAARLEQQRDLAHAEAQRLQLARQLDRRREVERRAVVGGGAGGGGGRLADQARGEAVSCSIVALIARLNQGQTRARQYGSYCVRSHTDCVVLYTALYMAATRTQIYLTSAQRQRLDALGHREGKALAELVRAGRSTSILAQPSRITQAALDATFGALPRARRPLARRVARLSCSSTPERADRPSAPARGRSSPPTARVSYSTVTRAELFAGRASEEAAVRKLLDPFRELAVDRPSRSWAGAPPGSRGPARRCADRRHRADARSRAAHAQSPRLRVGPGAPAARARAIACAAVRIFSGIQPTGRKHLGNYIGAIRSTSTARTAATGDLLHRRPARDDASPTTRRSCASYALDTAAILLAAGLDPERCDPLPPVRRAGALASCAGCCRRSPPYGDLHRMHQFKEKSERERELVSAGPVHSTRCCRPPTSSPTTPTRSRWATTSASTSS